jgi:hypothetical protein
MGIALGAPGVPGVRRGPAFATPGDVPGFGAVLGPRFTGAKGAAGCPTTAPFLGGNGIFMSA